jgi:hypothetical protein
MRGSSSEGISQAFLIARHYILFGFDFTRNILMVGDRLEETNNSKSFRLGRHREIAIGRNEISSAWPMIAPHESRRELQSISCAEFMNVQQPFGHIAYLIGGLNFVPPVTRVHQSRKSLLFALVR